MKGLIITATNSGAGKTYISCLILKALREKGINAVGYLPVSCGMRSPARLLHDAGPKDIPLEDVNPIYLKNNTAPYVSSLLENSSLDMEVLRQKYLNLSERFEFVIVDGIGGWETPLTEDARFSDFAASLDLPALLVANNNPGMLNHAILTVNAIRARGVDCLGLAVNNIQEEWDTIALTSRGVISTLTNLPVLAELISGQDYIDEELLLDALGLAERS